MFSMDNQVLEDARQFKLKFGDQTVKYNPTPKLLGVTLDEKLKFETHINMIECKGLRSLNSLIKVKETEVVDSSCMLSREVVGNLLDGCNVKTAVAFTDGSCLGNPGPCGAGACVFRPGSAEPILLKHPVSCYGSIIVGELIAIKLAVRQIQVRTTENEQRIIEKLHIFSDSQCAIGHLVLGWEPKSHISTVCEVKADIQKLEQAGVEVEISWTPSHSDIKGNDWADKLAKEAAEEAKEMEVKELPPILTLGDIKTAARESVRKKCQDMWDKSEKGRHLFNYRPFVDYKLSHKFDRFKGERIVAQLRTGYVKLNDYLHYCNIQEDNLCQC